MELNGKTVKKIMLLIVFAIIAYTAIQNFALIYNGIASLFVICSPIIAGCCIAFVLNVLLRQIEGKILKRMGTSKNKIVRKAQRPCSLILTIIVALGIVAVVLLVIIPEVSSALMALFEKLPSYINEAMAWAEGLLSRFNIAADVLPNIQIDWDGVISAVSKYLTDGSGSIINTATNVTSSVVRGLASAVFSIILAVYVLAKKERVIGFTKNAVRAYLPKKISAKIIEVAHLSNEVFANFVKGQLVEAVILGLLCFIGMTIFNFPYAPVISLFICVTAIIPIVGALMGEIVGTVLILFVSPIKALFFLIFILVLQQLESTLIYPRVVGKSVGLPGVLVLSAVIIGGNISGILGALLATPICAVVYVLVGESIDKRLYKKDFIKRVEGDGSGGDGEKDKKDTGGGETSAGEKK